MRKLYHVVSDEKLTNEECSVSGYSVVVKTPNLCAPQIWSLSQNVILSQMLQTIPEGLSINCLAIKERFAMHNSTFPREILVASLPGCSSSFRNVVLRLKRPPPHETLRSTHCLRRCKLVDSCSTSL